MRTRIVLHLVVFAALLGIGAWVAYQSVVALVRIGPLEISVETAAMYWFTLLVYLFVCLVVCYPLRRRASWALLMGHAVAVIIALTSTATLVTLSYRNAPQASSAPAASAGAPATEDPSAQPLSLPPENQSQS